MGVDRLRFRSLLALVAVALMPAGAQANFGNTQCVVRTGLEFEDAVSNMSCQAIKATAFEIGGLRLDRIFDTFAATEHQGRSLDALVLSGTKLIDGAALSIGRAIKESWIKPRNLIFWNNGLDSSQDKSSEGYVALMEIIRAAKTDLQELHFTDNLLLDVGAADLGGALAEAASISKLVLSGNGITPPGVEELCSSLKNSPIDSLSITGVEGGANSWMSNNVEVEGGRGVASLLAAPNTRLSTLVLSGGNVGDKGLIEISRGIKGNTHLTQIDLHRNSISDEGIMVFAEAIESATSLELVILTANKISDDGAFALAKAIRLNPALRVVDCDMNTRVSQAGRDAIAAALDRQALNVGRHEEL